MGWQDAPEVESPVKAGQPSWMNAPEVAQTERASMGDVIAGTPLARLAMGAASPLIGVAQLGAHIGDTANKVMGVKPVVSPWIDKQIAAFEAAKQRGMKASGTEGFDAMGLIGSLAPGAAIGTGMSAAFPVAQTLGQRVGLGAMQGGTAAAVQPVTDTTQGFWSPKGMQAAAGSVIGGAIPLVTEVGKGLGKIVHQAVQPFTEKGRATILRELQDGVMSNDPHLRKIARDALRSAKPGVGGVMPTAGEVLAGIDDPTVAAKFTGLMAHQKNIAKIPGVSPDFQARSAAQEAAREAEIGTIAKTPQALEQAKTTRGDTAKLLYGTAEKEIVTPDVALKTLMARPSMQSVVRRAAELAKEKGDVFKIGQDLPEQLVTSPIVSASGQPITHTIPEQVSEYPVKSLHYMKMAMDDLIKDPERFGIGANEAKAIAGTQGEFTQWIGGKSPLYRLARETYKAQSGPMNRMQVGQELQKSLTTPLGTSERSGMFAKAVEDAPRTIKRATGQQMFDTLDEVLSKPELRSVAAVSKELANKDMFERLARQTSLSGHDAIPGNVGLPLPNLLSRPAMIANFMLRHAGKGAEEKIGLLAQKNYLNPNQFANALEDVPPRYAPMMNAMRERIPALVGTATGRAAQP